MKMVHIKDLIYRYFTRDDDNNIVETIEAIAGVNMDVEQGQFIAILGHNGSGKSSLAKHINGLLQPAEGAVYVKGMNTADEDEIWQIRQTAGIVLQNPDNQIIGNIVEEDVAFGPENIGVPTEDIWRRVAQSLEAVGMEAFRLSSPGRLSGGQKQRVAIAGILAMEPECIILDEPTAMLDPKGREDVIRTIHQLNREKGITIILITHKMDEVVEADKLFVMDHGKVVMSGTPKEVFSDVEQIKKYRLEVPHATELAYELRKEGIPLPESIMTKEELVEALCRLN
ncbi:MAG TPA: energy-coupling factor transporter ATPase [Candidatus Fimousia stercorigallinarum]|nr:energy-coupling factor transporter ATPase [Candidatus Fimousia stercorigallinarum]